MKSYQLRYETPTTFENDLKRIKEDCKVQGCGEVVFHLTWHSHARDCVSTASSIIESVFPEANYFGNEASGSIMNGRLMYGVVVNCYAFADLDTRTELLFVEEGGDPESLSDLWGYCRGREDLRAVELIPTLTDVDYFEIENNEPVLDPDVAVFGAAAVNYDNLEAPAEILAKGYGKRGRGMVVMLYYGRNLRINAISIGGWRGMGGYKLVTKSEGRIIREIDNSPAFELYEKYLNSKVGEHDNLVFPLVVDDEGTDFIRIPKCIGENKSIVMLNPVPEGSRVRISYNDKNTILQTIYDAIPRLCDSYPQAIKAFSCAARRLYWGDEEIARETIPVQEVAPTGGSYTGGEILRFGHRLKMMNATLVLVSMREGRPDEEEMSVERVQRRETDKSLVTKITYFAERLVEEQEEQKSRLAQTTALSDYFVSTFINAYYCNLKSGEVVVLKRGKMPSIVHSPRELLRRQSFHVDELTYIEDRHITRAFLSFEYIRAQLKSVSEFSFTARCYNGEKTYRFTLLRGDDDDHIGLGITDITDELREQMDNEQRLKDALEMADAASRAKTDFLFNMSHDIRTPMNAVLGFTAMAKKHLDDKEKLLDCLEKIDQSGELLLSLINSVLDISRIESGHASQELSPGDVYFSFENLKSTMNVLAKEKNVELTFDFGEITDRFVYCDFNHATRVFVNIISNAIKYSNGGWVRVKCEQVGRNDRLGFYRYTVADNGIGMSEEFKKRAFESFSRENDSTNSGIQGTGIGLAVSKAFVELMGGTIEFESEKGKGTTFVITLPFQIQQGETFTEPSSGEIIDSNAVKTAKSDLSGKRALLCEDNEFNREIATDLLQENGIEVQTAENGARAVELLKEKGPENYDFILMDIQMPIMNGYEAAKVIRSMYPEHHIPIIALSANAFYEDVAASLEAGMDDHVAKPIEIHKLIEAIAKLI